jgi:hypothetical protein
VLAPAVERFQERSGDERHDFRGQLTDYVRLYAFLSQVLTFGDADLEKLYVFARHLRRLLPSDKHELPVEVQQNIDMEAAGNQRRRRRGRPQTNSRSLANLIPHRYKPGESGNHGGRTDQYLEAQRICRDATPAAARKMVALMDSEDERVALMAADKVFERAWGKPREYNPENANAARDSCH